MIFAGTSNAFLYNKANQSEVLLLSTRSTFPKVLAGVIFDIKQTGAKFRQRLFIPSMENFNCNRILMGDRGSRDGRHGTGI
jgi:hypothetical protein